MYLQYIVLINAYTAFTKYIFKKNTLIPDFRITLKLPGVNGDST